MGQFFSAVFANALGSLIATIIVGTYKQFRDKRKTTFWINFAFAFTFGITFYLLNELSLRLLINTIPTEQLPTQFAKWKLIIVVWIISFVGMGAGIFWLKIILPYCNRWIDKYQLVNEDEPS